MNPAWSIIAFTLLAGCGQGLLVVSAWLVFSDSGSRPVSADLRLAMLIVAGLLITAGLLSSFLHLGRKGRAWRAAAMWRTSWMSREVIVLPALLAVVAAWVVAQWSGRSNFAVQWLALAGVLLAALLWWCTAMIYACLRFVREWAHPMTVLNFGLIGLSSGCIAAGWLATVWGEAQMAHRWGPWVCALTLLAGAARAWSLRRNAALKPVSTVQSATGIPGARVVQVSMGFTGGSFNTREFFHRAGEQTLLRLKPFLLIAGFVVPALLLLTTTHDSSPSFVRGMWTLALLVQTAGLMAERWMFFAQAQHPQNLYYQRVS